MTSEPTALTTPRAGWQNVQRLFQRTEWGLLAAIVVVVLLTATVDTQHVYFTRPGDSAINILRQTALLGIFALGAAVVIIAGGIDLSMGSVVGLGAVVFALLLEKQVSPWLAVVLVLAGAPLIGLFHGLLNSVVAELR